MEGEIPTRKRSTETAGDVSNEAPVLAGHRYQSGHPFPEFGIESDIEKLAVLAHELRGKNSVHPEELRILLSEISDLLARIGRQQARFGLSLDALAQGQQELDARISALENSRPFRYARRLGRLAAEWKARAGQLLLHSPFHSLYLRLFHRDEEDRQYRVWLERQEIKEPSSAWYADRIAQLTFRPRFTILMPTHNPQRDWLDAAFNSVESQSYPDWELSICDDASTEPWVREYLERKAANCSRVSFVAMREHRGISGALNQAGRVARGDYIAFLDQDDVLSPHALFHVAEALQSEQADIIYSDEDRISPGGRRVEPTFKPGWSPDLLNSCMYMGHLLVVSRAAIDEAGWFRSDYDGSQDYDLSLRITDRPAIVRHIPRLLYHWRKHEGSTAAHASAKPYTHLAGLRALEDAVRRRGLEAAVSEGFRPNTYRLEHKFEVRPLASIIIVSRNGQLLDRCLAGINKSTSYPDREVIVVQHKTGNDREMDEVVGRYGCKRVPYSGRFDFATMNNSGAEAASGQLLVFLNDDVIPLAPGWLHAMISQAQRPEVGVVGGKLLYPSRAIQHAGIVVGIMDGCGHPLRGAFAGKYWHWADVIRNVSAVTAACMAVRKEVFDELEGFDPIYPVNYNDADLCLRARNAGYEVIYEPAALLRHDECQTRVAGTAYDERLRWRQRWATAMSLGDQFYNPNLTRVREDASLRIED